MLDGPGDQIPVETKLSASFQTDPGAHLAGCKWVPGLVSGGKSPGARCCSFAHIYELIYLSTAIGLTPDGSGKHPVAVEPKLKRG